MDTTVHLCKASFEELLRRELTAVKGGDVQRRGLGWVQVHGRARLPADLCFACASLQAPTELHATSVNAMVGQMADYFRDAFRDEKVTEPWPVVFAVAPDVDGLGGRAALLERHWLETMRGRMSRVLKLATTDVPPGNQPLVGFHAFLIDYERLFATCRFRSWGQRRMKDDPLAPSRSYLKVEEAYTLLGREPAPGESVADLGAAPGGWSYSAARRGARVVAIDNGPLKAGAAGHPLIDHRCTDAFTFQPPPGHPCDWLFCDIIDNPYRILDLLERWVTRRWCRQFVVNLKMGLHDPIALLERVRRCEGTLATACRLVRARQLFHDREEITVVGTVVPP